MYGLALLIGGIILMANDAWFGGAQTVGFILTALGAAVILLKLVIYVIAGVVLANEAERKKNRFRY